MSRATDIALQLIHKWEGFKSEAYQDQGGVWTFGAGLTFHPDGRPVKQGDKISEADSKRIVQTLVEKIEMELMRGVTVPVTANQLGALISLAFNVGTTAVRHSTAMRKLKARDYKGAADAILMWNKVKGQVSRGLVNRREDERRVFLGE